ncbi:MAG TPA: hypothetical protein VN577_12420 [Terriglobales bacterium]|nr:hypothetical protein [Terriglobales bacterium]
MSSAKRFLAISLTFMFALFMFSICAPRTVQAIAAALVQVVNTPSNPVPVQPVPAKQAVRMSCHVEVPSGAYFEDCTAIDNVSSNTFVVPTGKRFVADFVGANGSSTPTQGALEVWVVTNNLEYLSFAVTPLSISGSPIFTLSERTTFYADPGTSITMYLQTNSSSGGTYGNIILEGHLEDIQ